MNALFGAMVVVAIGWHVAEGAPRKVLVLPLDGSVEPATRARLNGAVQKLASHIDGTVTVGDTTFGETAAVLGCDAETSACAESVRTTLGVDELVYGHAATTSGTTTLTVRRVRAKTAWREGIATFGVDDAPERADASVDAELSPLFDVQPAAPPPDIAPPVIEAPVVQPRSTSARTRGILLASAGGASLVLGVILWANVASTQSEIDDANPQSDDDFRDLEAKEDKAQRNAIIGDVLVVAGVGLATWGAYTIYKSRRAEVTIAPTATPTSAGISLGGQW